MRIGLRLAWLNGCGFANFIGDHAVAMGWQKYINLHVEHRCEIVGPDGVFSSPQDVVIHFHPGMPRNPKVYTILYNQNSWPREQEYGGTVGVFEKWMDYYDGHIFVSDKLKAACFNCLDDSLVLPFATDPEIFYPQLNERFRHPVVFVGNDIRGAEANERWLAPWLDMGLVIYGGPFRDPKFQRVNRGRLSMEDLPKVYSSAEINLNFGIPIANEYGITPMRAYEVRACRGTLVSDVEPIENLSATWADRVDTLLKWLNAPEEPPSISTDMAYFKGNA